MLRLPRISLVIPSLNQGRFIDTAIRSVLHQHYPALELIVIDGASSDGSVATIEGHGSRLAHWVSEPDHGPADALNKGFRRATGDILGFLNADDFLLPGALAAVARAFTSRPKADVISGHGYFATAAGDMGPAVISDRWDPLTFSYDACVLVQAATFFRRAAFRQTSGFNEGNETTWDMELWADLALAGATFDLVDDFLAGVRLHPASITGQARLWSQRRRDARAVREKFKGRREDLVDRAVVLGRRLIKYSQHPVRPLYQRGFVYSTLHRWSL